MAAPARGRGSRGKGRSQKGRRQNPYRGRDAHAEAARKAGYAARSVFKLEEIDRRVRLLRPGQRVLDLGGAPGSWSQYAAARVGPSGRLLTVDLQPIRVALPPHCTVIQGDAFGLDGELRLHAPYDVVLSDMAPNTTGDRGTDQIRSAQLFGRALDVALDVLADGGSFVGKIFMSNELDPARARMRQHFGKVRILRPEAVRDVSYEVFLVGLDKL